MQLLAARLLVVFLALVLGLAARLLLILLAVVLGLAAVQILLLLLLGGSRLTAKLTGAPTLTARNAASTRICAKRPMIEPPCDKKERVSIIDRPIRVYG